MDWQEQIAASITRGINAAVDVTVAREMSQIPGWRPNNNQTTPGGTIGGGVQNVSGQVQSLLPLVLLAAGLVVAFKLLR